MDSLTNAEIRALKATLKIGKEGLSPQFLAALDEVLKHRELAPAHVRERLTRAPYQGFLHQESLIGS